MALITHQMQGSYVTFSSRPLPWTKRRDFEVARTAHTVRRTSRCTSLKHSYPLRVVPRILAPKTKPLKILAFKGNAQNDEIRGRSNGSKSPKNSIKLSYKSQESEEARTESPTVQNIPNLYKTSEGDEVDGSTAIHNLFKRWLALLRTQSVNHVEDRILKERLPRRVESGIHTMTLKKEKGEILKGMWCYFLGLDAMIKIPLLIFVPLYLAVNIVYGAEVSKELTPFWVLGPLIIALYIKMLKGLAALYVFSFKQTVKVLRNLPSFYLLAYNHIAQGKIKEDLQAYLWQPLVHITKLDYKEVAKEKMKDLEVWVVEKYLDFVESIWPFYCRTIRFLKRANLI